jgi:hypothetical protein
LIDKPFGFKLMYMKARLLILFTIISICTFSQTESAKMSTIDKTRNSIKSNIDKYTKTAATYDTSGYRYVYKDGNKVCMIMVDYRDMRVPGTYIDKKVEWYFSNDQLIYSQQVWVDLKTNEIVDNEKFYLNNNHLFSWIQTDNTAADTTSPQFKYLDSQFSAYSKHLTETAK